MRKIGKSRIYILVAIAAALILAVIIYASYMFSQSNPQLPTKQVTSSQNQTQKPGEIEQKTPVSQEKNTEKLTFNKTVPYNAGHVYKLAWGNSDLNDYPDMAIANYNSQNYFFINENGILEKNPQFGTGYSVDLKWADFNKDGLNDLLIMKYNQKNSLFINKGDNKFEETNVLIKGYAKAMVVDDFNNDGFQDVFVAYDSEPNYVFLNEKNGSFQSVKIEEVEKLHSISASSCDLDGDGFKDIVLGTDFQKNYILINNGNGTFTATPNFGEQFHTRAIVCKDLNGDGLPDVIVGNDNQASNADRNFIYVNNGNFNFTPSPKLGAYKTYAIDTADFNQDGLIDVVIGNYNEDSYVYLNRGQFKFEIGAVLAKDYVLDVNAVDVNKDGYPDISTALDKNGVAVHFNLLKKA